MDDEKETFDFEVFARMYPNSNGPRRLDPKAENDRKFYEKLYYADESVKTIEEFVDKQDALDASSF